MTSRSKQTTDLADVESKLDYFAVDKCDVILGLGNSKRSREELVKKDDYSTFQIYDCNISELVIKNNAVTLASAKKINRWFYTQILSMHIL